MKKLNDYSFGKFKYILYEPSGEHLPLIIVLHGSGEVGSSISKLKKRAPYLSLKNGDISPHAYVLMPQLPSGSWGKSTGSLKKLIDHVVSKFNCDPNSISITGHSLGGAGTMDMLIKHPDYFAAAASLSPCQNYKDKLQCIVDVPIWFFYGERESKFASYTKQMKSKLDSIGGNAKITCVKGKGHAIQFCWCSPKYHLFDWLTSYSLIEPQYPTWFEFIRGLPGAEDIEDDQELVKWMNETTINADFAKGLGVKPKEVANG